ncbi:hypothetical protein HID58_012384 [Brassica napus]|uniref:Uncharacterized protein n=1 Tax=Brassica napus TaxID=3708 RepID=A0ABQ8E0W2_BRANA|nr:hypothetical protein HID58_012384 [Brassica napus]
MNLSSPRPRLYMWLGIDNMNVLLSSSSSPDFNVSTMSSLVVDQDLTIPAMEGYSVSQRTLNISIDPQETTDFYVFLYNIQKNHMRKVEITKSSSRYVTTKWDVIGLDDVENLMYL